MAARWMIRTTTASLLPESARAFVAGHRVLVSSAVARRLAAAGRAVLTRARAEPDLRDAARTAAELATLRPDTVELAAPRVGGSWPTAPLIRRTGWFTDPGARRAPGHCAATCGALRTPRGRRRRRGTCGT